MYMFNMFVSLPNVSNIKAKSSWHSKSLCDLNYLLSTNYTSSDTVLNQT